MIIYLTNLNWMWSEWITKDQTGHICYTSFNNVTLTIKSLVIKFIRNIQLNHAYRENSKNVYWCCDTISIKLNSYKSHVVNGNKTTSIYRYTIIDVKDLVYHFKIGWKYEEHAQQCLDFSLWSMSNNNNNHSLGLSTW